MASKFPEIAQYEAGTNLESQPFLPHLTRQENLAMNGTVRKLLVGAAFLGSAAIVTPAFAGDSVSTSVDPVTGATTTVEHHGAILPRNRTTTVTTTPAPMVYPPAAYPPASYQPDAYAAPGYPPVVQRQTTTTTTY
jgi:hypothetical protein